MTSPKASRRQVVAGIGSSVFFPMAAFGGDANVKHLKLAEAAAKAPRPKSGILRIMHPRGSEANLRPVVEAFSELTGVDIELVEEEVLGVATSLLVDRMLGTPRCDVALPATFNIPDLVAGDALISHDEFASPDLPELLNNDLLYSEGDSFEGKTYGYQTDGDAYLPFFNKEFLENERLVEEYATRFSKTFDIPSSWEELDRQIVFVSQRAENSRGALLLRAPGFLEWEFWLRLLAKGVWPLSFELEPQIAGEAGVSVLEEMIAVAPYLTPDSRLDTALFDNWTRFEEGRTFMTLSWGGGRKFFQRSGGPLRDKIVFGQMPGGEAEGTPKSLPNFNWGWSYAIAKGSAAPELSHLFCRFAVSPAISVEAVKRADGFFDPFRQSHYDDPDIRNIYGDDFLSAHRKAMAASIPDFYLADRSAYFSSLNVALDAALVGRLSPANALKQAEKEWNLISRESDLQKQRRRWQLLRDKYPEDVAKYLRDEVF